MTHTSNVVCCPQDIFSRQHCDDDIIFSGGAFVCSQSNCCANEVTARGDRTNVWMTIFGKLMYPVKLSKSECACAFAKNPSNNVYFNCIDRMPGHSRNGVSRIRRFWHAWRIQFLLQTRQKRDLAPLQLAVFCCFSSTNSSFFAQRVIIRDCVCDMSTRTCACNVSMRSVHFTSAPTPNFFNGMHNTGLVSSVHDDRAIKML